MTSNRIRATASAFVLAALGGCVSTYEPAPNEEMATIRSIGFGRPQICKDGQMFWAPPAKDVADGVSVPAGRRVTVGTHISDAGYQVVHFCRPFMSFQPEAGKTYLMNSGLSGNGRCFIELVREDVAADTGVSVERSLGAPYCPKP